jgi:hypothetical protein
MIKRKETILDEDIVIERLELLRKAGYPADDILVLLDQSVTYGPQDAAETVVRETVPQIPEERLSEAIARFLLPPLPGGLDWPDMVDAPHILIEQLVSRGFNVVEGQPGWTITTPEGDSFTRQFRDRGMIMLETMSLPSRGVAFAQAALEAGLVHIVRSTPPTSGVPAF